MLLNLVIYYVCILCTNVIYVKFVLKIFLTISLRERERNDMTNVVVLLISFNMPSKLYMYIKFVHFFKKF